VGGPGRHDPDDPVLARPACGLQDLRTHEEDAELLVHSGLVTTVDVLHDELVVPALTPGDHLVDGSPQLFGIVQQGREAAVVSVLGPEEHGKASDLPDVGQAVDVEVGEAARVQVTQQLETPHGPDGVVEQADAGPGVLEDPPEEGGPLGGLHVEPVQIGEDIGAGRQDSHLKETLVGDDPHTAQQLLPRRQRGLRGFERRAPGVLMAASRQVVDHGAPSARPPQALSDVDVACARLQRRSVPPVVAHLVDEPS
jgi:hypothetical protein